MSTILIADDEARIRRLVSDFLKRDGHIIVEAADGKEALNILENRRPGLDMAILDVMMPGEDGFATCRRIRALAACPILFLTAKTEEADVLTGLGLGGDDYLSKPFGIMELISRVKARLRGSGTAKTPVQYSYGGLFLSEEKHLVTVDGKPVELTYKEFELLKLLLSAPGNAFTRDVIMERIWGYNYELSSRTLDMHVKTLRQKLGAKGAMIQTIRNVGFKLERLEG